MSADNPQGTFLPSTSTRNRRIIVAAALLLLPILLFGRALFLGEAFVPADLLGYVAPWSHTGDGAPPAAWNVLRFDGITEFYPWRYEAARQIREGSIPLWNDHAFAANGGAPLLADSQSSPLYPPNVLFYLIPPSRLWYAFALVDALHLLILAAGMYRLLRAEGIRSQAALLGAATIALSGPVVAWLALPTFLAVACWLPWLLLAVRRAHETAGTDKGRLALVGAAAAAGMMLLAGHLQMAFYGLMATGIYALFLGIASWRRQPVGEAPAPEVSIPPTRWLAGVAGVLLLAILCALPQVLPTLELSRVSHRAGAPPTLDAYRGYIENALPMRNLVTFLVPDFFGNPNPTDLPYWNTNNYGEWAAYVGIVPLLLATLALALPWRGNPANARRRAFWATLGILALLLALGTPLNLPLFFLVPGYSQTGNPGRVLIVLAFSLAALAAHGLNGLLDDTTPATVKRRSALIGLAAIVLIGAIGASQAARFAAASPALAQVPFGQLMAIDFPALGIAGLLLVIGGGLIVALPRLSPQGRVGAGYVLGVLAVIDLYLWGGAYNPTSPAEKVFPITPGIAYLQEHGRDALIAPLNRNWSLGLFNKMSPRDAVLPPNTLTVYGLHDIGGYDSLFPKTAKTQATDAGGEDPSPPENGNMVFVKSPRAALALGARYLILSPPAADRPSLAAQAPPAPLREAYRGDDMVIWENPTGRDFDPSAGHAYRPDSFRVGLFCGLLAAAALAASLTALLPGESRSRRAQEEAGSGVKPPPAPEDA